jgi:ABC-2 type transport system permease protein
LQATLPSRLLKPWRAIRSNPVMIKELRGRMRGRRAFVVLTIYAGLLSAFAAAIYLLYASAADGVSGPPGQLIGKIVFGVVVITELLLVCFVTPALTASAISGERERQTFDLLCTTLLPARSLVTGKLFSALSYIVLLIVAGVPLQSLAFFLGGVTPEEVILSVVLLLATALTFAVAGLFFSSLSRTTLGSTVLSYAFALTATAGIPMLASILLPVMSVAFVGVTGSQPPSWQVQAALMYLGGFLLCTNPFLAAILTEVVLLEKQTAFLFQVPITAQHNIWLISPWIVYTALCLLLSLILLAWSVWLLKRKQV